MTRSEWKAAARARLGGGIFKDQWLMGLGVMLAAGEIPRIAGMFRRARALLTPFLE